MVGGGRWLEEEGGWRMRMAERRGLLEEEDCWRMIGNGEWHRVGEEEMLLQVSMGLLDLLKLYVFLPRAEGFPLPKHAEHADLGRGAVKLHPRAVCRVLFYVLLSG